MDPSTVKQKVIKVLQDIQSTSGLACPTLYGTTKPIEDLADFDSKIWPVATGLLANELGVVIADDINIFREDRTRRALTLDETVAVVMKVAQAANPSAAGDPA